MQSHLVVLANGGRLDAPSMREPDLPGFLASLSSAWRSGEVRPTHSEEAQPRYLRPLREVITLATVATRQLDAAVGAKIAEKQINNRHPRSTIDAPVGC